MASSAHSIVDLKDYVFFQEGPGLRKWQWTEAGMKVINVTNILAGGSIDISNTSRFISLEEFQKKYSHFAIDVGDVVVASSGNTYGKVGRIKACHLPVMMNTSVIRFRPINPEVVHPDYLYAFLRSDFFRSQIERFVVGSAQPNFGPTHVKLMQLILPEWEHQRRIASIVSAYDDLIENNTRRIEILEEMARRLYEEWFVQFRFPGHEGVAFKKMPIHDVVNVVRGRSYRSADLVENGRPFVNLKCINRDGGYRRDGLKYYSGKYKPEQLVSSGDIVMAVTDMTQERRIVARAALVPDLGELQGVISMDLVRIIPKDGVSALYLYAFFRWSDFSDNVKNHATGANVLHLHPDLIANYDIDLPPQEVCKSFEDKVRPAIELADVLEKKNANLRVQRDLLLPKLISGEIDVSDIPMPT